MNGDVGVKKAAALNQVKQVAKAATSAANASANGIKKRRKDLKPIITGEGQQSGSGQGSAGSTKRCVCCERTILVLVDVTCAFDPFFPPPCLSACFCCCGITFGCHILFRIC